jgi:hypothetical protein
MKQNRFDADTPIVPQHYPLWVEEWIHDQTANYYRYHPIVGWVWRENGGILYLHPVTVEELGAAPYEPNIGGSWMIRDHKPTEAKED